MIRRILQSLIIGISMTLGQWWLIVIPTLLFISGMIIKIMPLGIDPAFLSSGIYVLICLYQFIYYKPLKYGIPVIIKRDENGEVVQTESANQALIQKIDSLNKMLEHIHPVFNLIIFFIIYGMTNKFIKNTNYNSFMQCLDKGIAIVSRMFVLMYAMNVLNMLLMSFIGVHNIEPIVNEEENDE